MTKQQQKAALYELKSLQAKIETHDKKMVDLGEKKCRIVELINKIEKMNGGNPSPEWTELKEAILNALPDPIAVAGSEVTE